MTAIVPHPQSHRSLAEDQAALKERPAGSGGNGGFPEPVVGEPLRTLRRVDPRCGAETRIRIPEALPERAVRRVVCSSCARVGTGSLALRRRSLYIRVKQRQR
jgi:hypothetical protein